MAPRLRLRLLVLFVLGSLLPARGQATRYLVGELTYEPLAGAPANQYRVHLRRARDCSGPGFKLTKTLSCRAGSPQTACPGSDPRNFTATFTRIGPPMIGQPYCSIHAVPLAHQCAPAAPFSYEEASYEASVTLPPAPEWLLNREGGRRPVLGNEPDADRHPMRLDATLRNALQVNGAARVIE